MGAGAGRPEDRPMPRTTILLATSAAALALLPATAPAAQQFGQVAADGAPTICTFNTLTTIGNSAAYAAPAAGVITSMRTGTFAPLGTTVKFRAFRETIVGTVALGTAETKTGEDKKAAALTRIPVSQGDRIGLSKPAGAFSVACVTSTDDSSQSSLTAGIDPADGTPFSDVKVVPKARANVAATLEPDADKDGYGDETQDGCPSSIATHGACPVPGAPAPEVEQPADEPAGPPADVRPASTPVVAPATTTAAASCTVPKLRGLTVRRAKRKLRAAHCVTGSVRKARDARGTLTVRKATRKGARRVNLVVG